MENTEKPSAPESSSSAGGAKEKVEKQARQLAYDVRYKTKQAMSQKSGGQLDPAAVRKAYASQLGKSPAAPAVKARAKQMLLGEDIIDIDRIVAQGAANAMYKVFVENKNCCKKCGSYEHTTKDCPEEKEIKEETGEKTYKIRVTDKKTGNSYVRMATRAKISELRANSNISSVEMTGYGEPTKSEKHKGSQTAAAKAGKDYDGDGKVESPRAEYKGSKDKAIKKALAREDFTWKDAFGELIEKKSEDKKITGKGVDNSKLITVFPSEGEDVKEQVKPGEEPEAKAPVPEVDPQLAQKQKRVGLAKRQILLKKMQAVRAGAGEEITASHHLEGEDIADAYTVHSADKKGNTPAWQGYKSGKTNVKTGEPLYKKGSDVKEDSEYGYDEEGKSLNPEDKKKESKKKEEEDPRGMSTKVNLVRNKLRAMGLKMSHEPEGENIVDEGLIGSAIQGVGKAVGGAENVATGAVKKTASAVGGAVKGTAGAAKKVVKTVGGAVSGGAKSSLQKEGVTATHKGTEYKLLPGKVRKDMKGKAKGGLDGDYRDGVGKAKDWVTDKLGITNTKRDGVKCPKGLLGHQDCNSSYEPEGEMVDENRMAAYTAGAGEGSPASRPTVSKKTADKVSRSSDEHAFGNRKKKEGIRLSPTKKYSGKDKGKVVKRANTTGRGTPTQYRKSHEDPDMGRYQQKVTQGTGSMKNLKKEDLDPAVLNALNALDSYMKNESVGSAVDKSLSAGADVAKVAGKAATGGVKVASKVVKGAAKTAATVAGTPIGAVKALKKGFQSGTQAESVGSAIDKGLSAGADVAKVAGKAAVGGVKVASKVVKGAAKTAAHVAGTPIGAVKAIKKGFKSGSDANESYDPAVLNALSALDTYMQSNDHLHGSVLAKKK